MNLQRLVLTQEGVEIRNLYRTRDGPGPNTKARTKEVSKLTRTGKPQGRVDVVGKSGYDVREDVLVAETDRRRKGGAA